ncbi:bifunctional coenzyme A synthase isoform X2 [Aricia agestis]|uniref:bifunctional coenzyme A synthase isoform X1 n=1 Tax=Aricia agestis TaxID=91739 RepID=UPI001C2054AB|nr:bifunctional coenzyme A synthase isoform X1 [Aricia agestis]XP_041979058.1 bifunctional coenzyme A synthase isoform X2 [Aricia agestis]
MYNVFWISVIALFVSVVISYFFISHCGHSVHSVLDCSKAVTMANNGILLISNAAKAHKFCSKVSNHVKKILYISYNEGTDCALKVLNKQNVDIYSKTTDYSNLDVRLILKPRGSFNKIKTNHPIDLILYDTDAFKKGDNLANLIENGNKDIEQVPIAHLDSHNPDISNEEPVKTFEYVALGGTFDRLHNGHKILLSQAVLRATKHVTVGVTDVNMIKSKILWELIEPVERRIANVLEFLTDINPDLEYHVLPIQDLYGPTKDDPRYQLIVVSEETQRGAVKINEKRKENGLNPLETYTISLAADQKRSPIEEDKVSSSNQRIRLLGTLLREPKPNPDIPKWPYVIGIAGGIASGKSSITEKLKKKGATVINCDLLAHELYKPGLPLNRTISATFGADVITERGEVDRQRLGQIVFGDKAQLERLNSITWPAIAEEVVARVRRAGEGGARVVVLEAAVMVRAGWHRLCHQLWAVIVPPEEAIKRIQQRNNLTEEQARQRVEAQPANSEHVAEAHVVFSPYWSYEFTQDQVDRAWEQLADILKRH